MALILAVGTDELRESEDLPKQILCMKCGQEHVVIDSTPPGYLQAVHCSGKTILVGVSWKKIAGSPVFATPSEVV